MKIGCCVGIDSERAKIAKDLGYDFVESNCSSIVNAPFEDIEKLKAVGIPVFSANCFIPLRIIGDEKDETAVKEYLAELFRRADYLGMKIIVFGSSGARKAKEGQDKDFCRNEIVNFLINDVAPLCEKYNIKIAIEPLRPQECNVINTVPQAMEIADRVNSPYIRSLADVRHMVCQDDSLEALAGYGDRIIHAHTSNPYPEIEGYEDRRVYPKDGDRFDQDLFIRPLIAAGVGQCAVEADVIDFPVDAENAIKVLKKYQ